MVIRIIEFVFLVSMLMFLVTQVIIPFAKDKTLFPTFRKTGKLEHDLAEANQELSDTKLAQEIVKLKQEAEKQSKPDQQA